MIVHNSHAQEILSSDTISNPSDSIRKLAVDIERLRELYGETEQSSDKARESVRDLEDELDSFKIGYYITVFLLSLAVVVIFILLSKHA